MVKEITRIWDSKTGTITLPIVVTQRNKYICFFIFGFICLFFYLGSNWNHYVEATLLPMTWIDQAAPFVPWTIWIYQSELLLVIFAFILSKDSVNLNKYCFTCTLMYAFCALIFYFYPTTYPRGDFPLPHDLDAATFMVFEGLRQIDTPSNCLPSLHVASCYLTSFLFLNEQREKFPIFFLWATAVAVCTLTTKQHYVIDIFAGIIFAVVFYQIGYKIFKYRHLDGTQPSS